MSRQTNFQGMNGFEWFFGPIVDVNDPLELGRVRIRAFGIYTADLEDDDLPWAIQLQTIVSAGKDGIGVSPTGIEVGSVAFGFFVDADKQQPIVIGTYAGTGDINELAIGTNKLIRSQVGPEPASSYKSVYPFNKVTATSSGHVIEIDDSPGAERLHTFHKSGSYQEYQPNGIVINKSTDNMFVISAKDLFTHSEGDTIETAENHKITDTNGYDLSAKTISLSGTDSISIDGGSLDINGTKVTINSDGTVDIKGSKINLTGNVAVTGTTFTFNGFAVKAGTISG